MLQFKNFDSEFRIPNFGSTFHEFDTFADKRKCFMNLKALRKIIKVRNHRNYSKAFTLHRQSYELVWLYHLKL